MDLKSGGICSRYAMSEIRGFQKNKHPFDCGDMLKSPTASHYATPPRSTNQGPEKQVLHMVGVNTYDISLEEELTEKTLVQQTSPIEPQVPESRRTNREPSTYAMRQIGKPHDSEYCATQTEVSSRPASKMSTKMSGCQAPTVTTKQTRTTAKLDLGPVRSQMVMPNIGAHVNSVYCDDASDFLQPQMPAQSQKTTLPLESKKCRSEASRKHRSRPAVQELQLPSQPAGVHAGALSPVCQQAGLLMSEFCAGELGALQGGRGMNIYEKKVNHDNSEPLLFQINGRVFREIDWCEAEAIGTHVWHFSEMSKPWEPEPEDDNFENPILVAMGTAPFQLASSEADSNQERAEPAMSNTGKRQAFVESKYCPENCPNVPGSYADCAGMMAGNFSNGHSNQVDSVYAMDE